MKKNPIGKVFLYAALFVMMTAIALFSAGCGGSDKFSGDWIGNGTAIGSGDHELYWVNIKKNGSGNDYILTIKTSALHGVAGPEENTWHYYWSDPKEMHPYSGTAKDNILHLNGGIGSESITYNEEEKTLQVEAQWTTHLKLEKAKDVEKELGAQKASLFDSVKQEKSDATVDLLPKEEWDKKNEEATQKRLHQSYKDTPYWNPKMVF